MHPFVMVCLEVSEEDLLMDRYDRERKVGMQLDILSLINKLTSAFLMPPETLYGTE